jgi:hypothetical protein
MHLKGVQHERVKHSAQERPNPQTVHNYIVSQQAENSENAKASSGVLTAIVLTIWCDQPHHSTT